jgi:hypothetical protein
LETAIHQNHSYRLSPSMREQHEGHFYALQTYRLLLCEEHRTKFQTPLQ